MSYELAFLKSDKRIVLKDFSGAENSSRWMDLQEIQSHAPSALLYSEWALSEEVKTFLSQEARYYPIRQASEFDINAENFEKLEEKQAREIFDKASSNWILQNNLQLLKEMFKVLKHLKNLWPNDRTTFFEELWFILKTNLNASEMKIIYNHLQKGGEGEKDKLIRSKVEGIKNPEPQPGGEFEEKVLAHYEDEFKQNFSIAEYNPQRSELVLTAAVNKSPIVIMGRTPQITKLQENLLQAFFDGLQEES